MITKLLLAAIATLTFSTRAESAGKCVVYIQHPCHSTFYYGPHLGWFQDPDAIASVDVGRCLVRAREWLNYCNNPVINNQAAYTQFQKNGVSVGAASNYLHTYVYNPAGPFVPGVNAYQFSTK